MTNTEKRLEELDERLKEFAPTNTEQDIYLLAEDFKSFLTTSIQQAEQELLNKILNIINVPEDEIVNVMEKAIRDNIIAELSSLQFNK